MPIHTVIIWKVKGRFVRTAVVGPAVKLHGERTAGLAKLRCSGKALWASSKVTRATTGYVRCPRIASDTGLQAEVGSGLGAAVGQGRELSSYGCSAYG